MKNHFTEEQASTLQEALRGHHMKAMITVALVTGIRRDELLSLTWQQVDMEKGEISIQSTKTASNRRVPVSPDVIRLLQEHRTHQMQAKGEAGAQWQSHDLVFSDATGVQLTSHDFLKSFHNILKQAALPHVQFHDLRTALGQKLYEQSHATSDTHDNT